MKNKESKENRHRWREFAIIIFFLWVILLFITSFAFIESYHLKEENQELKEGLGDFLEFNLNIQKYSADRLNITHEELLDDYVRYYTECLITEDCEVLE